jgi:RNA polymerase sigma factor (sigma-70 family)
MEDDEIIKKYTPLVKSIASKYTSYGMPLDDLVQEGLIGLWDAIEKFDPTRDVKFSTYATYWIKKRILKALEDETKSSLNAIELNEDLNYSSGKDTPIGDRSQGVPVEPVTLPDNLPEIEKKVLSLLYGLNGEGSYDLAIIAKIMNLPRERVRQIKAKGLRRLRTLKKYNKDQDKLPKY